MQEERLEGTAGEKKSKLGSEFTFRCFFTLIFNIIYKMKEVEKNRVDSSCPTSIVCHYITFV